MFSDRLSAHPLLGLAADHRRLPRSRCRSGFTQGKEYAELEWPIDIAIAVVWVTFARQLLRRRCARRREKHLYVALWFYIATIVTVAMLHIFNNLVIPVGLVQELLDLRRRRRTPSCSGGTGTTRSRSS